MYVPNRVTQQNNSGVKQISLREILDKNISVTQQRKTDQLKRKDSSFLPSNEISPLKKIEACVNFPLK